MRTKTSLVLLIIFVAILVPAVLYYTGRPGSNSGENPGDSATDPSEWSQSDFDNKVDEINKKAVRWLEGLDVDPVALRYEMGVKGKKKFVEMIDSYWILFQTADNEQDKQAYQSKLEQLAKYTSDPSYHDMNTITDRQFRQDSASYLRAWYMLNRIEFDTSGYKQQIERMLPRFDAHLPSRGIMQKMAFVLYCNALGHPIDYTMEELLEQSVTRSAKDKTDLKTLELYYITHEVFALYDSNQMDLLTKDDIQYLTETLSYHVNRSIASNDIDLLAELVMTMTYLGLERETTYRTALGYLATNQNPDGSFGDYEKHRAHFDSVGIKVEIQLYLHTTRVCLWALNEAAEVFDH